VFLGLILSGCTFPWEKNRTANIDNTTVPVPTVSNEELPLNTNEIKKFKDEAELKQFLQNNASSGGVTFDRVLTEGFSNGMKNMAPSADMALGLSDGGTSVSSGSNYSTTNNQVFGVDEADIVKTDGDYIYALVKNDLLIIDAVPAAETKIVSKITFKSTPSDLFVSAGKLAVFGNDYRMYENAVASSFRRQSNYVFFKVFDVSNPAEPKETRSLNFEGNYTAARLIGNYVYFITNNYASYYGDSEPLTPRILENGKIISGGCLAGDKKCFLPEVYYFDAPYNNYNFTSINSINISDANELVSGQVYLINSSQNIYVSANNIYLTNTEYLSEYELEQEIKRENVFTKLAADNQDKIKKIEESPAFILSKEEKAMKVGMIVDNYFYSLDEAGKKALQAEIDSALLAKIKQKMKEMEKTIIHKITIKAGKAQYQTKGEVQGQVLNQFSMDEQGGNLRIATTRNEMWSKLFEDTTKSYSNVYILDENLRILGSLENIATDERIYSTRFMVDRVYVVTFKKTDPLYVIDLSNKTKPSVLGAVKIPGFSTYLHPADEKGTKLLGFGRDAEELKDGGVKVKGLKLSLFDFSDLSKPKELSNYIISDEDSDSLALNDHRAFLYSEAKNIISVPASIRADGKLSFSGSLIFTIDGSSLKLKGKIDHLGNLANNNFWGGYYNDNLVKRSLYIGNNLFTISDKYLKINNLVDLSEVKSLILTPGQEDYIITPVVQPETPTPSTTPLSTSTPPAPDSVPGTPPVDASSSVPVI
jgi:uncharacterized secreted protein with C-terminal beta-propeller domain